MDVPHMWRRKGSHNMSTVIQREAVVGPDGKIEIELPELAPGQHVTVTIEPGANGAQAPVSGLSMIDLIEQDPGKQLFKTADEVDEYIREERDAWDR
jgi:hypothetical protein